jgi:hypothetical protein
MGYLPQGVNTGVGAPAAGDTSIVIGNAGYGPLQAALHSRLLALDLPTQEFTSVVFEPDSVAQ